MMGSLNIILLLSILSIVYAQIVDEGPSAESIRRVQELRQILKKHETRKLYNFLYVFISIFRPRNTLGFR